MRSSGWVGVDLDGTLAHYEGWNEGKIGEPIPAMVERVKAWLAAGVEVRIFTARSSGLHPAYAPAASIHGDGVWGFEEYRDVVAPIRAWCEEHFGQTLTITNRKDFNMAVLWDDRCVQVEPNTGRRMDGKERTSERTTEKL